MKNKKQTQYRQGDVLIERVSSFPAKLTPVARENGRVILAHGEVTGHAHAFLEKGTTKFTDGAGGEFFEVKGQRILAELPIERHWRQQVLVRHPDLGLIEFAETDVRVRGETVLIDGEFGLLKHDEHNAQGIPAGLYRGGNAADKTVRQREYSPEEIRRVQD